MFKKKLKEMVDFQRHELTETDEIRGKFEWNKERCRNQLSPMLLLEVT